MSAEFRIVHFVSDPFLGARIPVAALLRDHANVVRVVRAQRLPAPECLGGPKHAAALRMILDALDSAPAFDRLPQAVEVVAQLQYGLEDSAPAFDRLPQAVGPFATMAEPRAVPDDVPAPAKWLGSHVLPTPITADVAGREREPKRARVGYRFFQSWDLHGYVKKRFKLEERWSAVFRGEHGDSSSLASIDSISHWVEGSSKLLLMEPLIPGRSSFSRDLHGVARSFSAFRYHLERLEPKKDVSLVAYMLSSQNRERRTEAITSLRDIAHEIVDLSDTASQQHFVHQVRAIGESGAPSPP
jgi:hypothetical protein